MSQQSRASYLITISLAFEV